MNKSTSEKATPQTTENLKGIKGMEMRMQLCDAIPLTKNWRDAHNGTPVNPVLSFQVDRQDLADLLAITDGPVRIYMAKDYNNTGNNDLKLILVAVHPTTGADMTNEAAGEYVYDFAKPCPDNCDISSPLYTGVLPEGCEG